MSFYTLHLVSLLFILLHLLCFIQLKNSFLTHSFGNQRRHIISKNIKNKISTTLLTAKFKKSSNTKRSLDFDAVDDENESDDDVESFDDDNITIEQIDQVTEKPRTTSTKPKSKTTQTTKSQASRSKTSSTNDDSKTTTSSTPSITPAWRETVESDIRSIITSTGDITILKLHIVQNRIELTVSNGAHDNEAIKQLSAEDLRSIHRQLYTAFELKEEELAVVTRFEILVATPGISDILKFERDFVSFQGFKVTVLTSEEFNKGMKHDGTLVGRCAEFVTISIKGRKLNIPRSIVTEVHLPKSKIEPTDEEMHKLTK